MLTNAKFLLSFNAPLAFPPAVNCTNIVWQEATLRTAAKYKVRCNIVITELETVLRFQEEEET